MAAASISVAMCTCNGARWVARQLQSILAQSVRPAEIIICDDHSADATLSEVARVAADSPVPIRLHVNDQNLGISLNFQRAMNLCQADLIAPADQDDVWHPAKLEKLASALQSHPHAAYAFCDARLVDQNLTPLGVLLWDLHQLTPPRQQLLQSEDALELLTVANFATGATMLFRRRWLTAISPVSRYWLHDGWLSLMLSAFAHCVLVNEPLVDYRQHPSQKVGACPRDQLRQLHWQRKMDRSFFAREAPRWADAYAFLASRRQLLRRQDDLELVRKRAMLDRDRLALRHNPEERWDRVAQHLYTGDYHRFAWGTISAAVDLLLHE